ncbi:hypothetical protein HDU67_002802 [Dinochytrium kinnereticum]|nr:hypothetical protein HDU67_002802 [Dinochytrium kinnereticum]
MLRLNLLHLRQRIATPRRFGRYLTTGSNPKLKENANEDYDGVYSKEKDPMAHMTEAEKEEVRRDVREGSQRAFSVGYGIVGGAMAAVHERHLASTTIKHPGNTPTRNP